MSTPRLLNDEGGVAEYFVWDEASDGFAITYEGDCTATLDRNKELYNDGTGGWSPSRELRRVASIPPEVQLKWKELYGVECWKKEPWRDGTIARLLDSSEWLYLRTAPGRLGKRSLKPVAA